MSWAQFWILLGVIISAATSILVAIINLFQNRRIQEIHLLVNDRLDVALERIEALQGELRGEL